MTRTLALRGERLAELTPAELGAVAGGAVPTVPPGTCVAISGLLCQVLSYDCASPSIDPCTSP